MANGHYFRNTDASIDTQFFILSLAFLGNALRSLQ